MKDVLEGPQAPQGGPVTADEQPNRKRVHQRLNEALDAITDMAFDYAKVMIAKERAERKQAQAERALIDANGHISGLRLERDDALAVASRAVRDKVALERHLEADHEDAKEATRLLNLALHLRMHGENAPGGTETWRQFDRECEHFLRWGVGGLDVPQLGYPPVRVPENTGKHPEESAEIGTKEE